MREMDWAAGQVLDTLRQEGIENKTLVFFTSDNGPHIELCLEGGSASLLTGGKSQTWEGGIRMPAIAWWPGTIQPGVSHTLASTMDIFATALDLAGVTPPSTITLDGRSLKTVLLGTNTSSPHNFLFHYCSSRLMAVRYGSYKVVYVTQQLADVDTYPEKDCIEGSPKGEIFAGHACVGKGTTVHDPPLIFNVDVDPSEVYPLQVENYKDMLEKVAAAVKNHAASLKPGTPQIGNHDNVLQPCCDAPKCTCNY